MSQKLIISVFIILICSAFLSTDPEPVADFVQFQFNKQEYFFTEKITPRPLEPSDNDPQLLGYEAEMESSLYYHDQNWVQIIRQDDMWNPHFGIGIGFEMHLPFDSLPYRPEKIAIQFKDFQFGGQHFSRKDTANYSGIYNDINGDLKLEITEFEGDTIAGNFSGVLLSGSGRMAHLEAGTFRIGLHRK
jgi:hypothetical protein